MNLIDAAIARARTTISVLVLILIAGTVAYIDIPKESDPDINVPIIYVSMTHEGISPEDAERLLISRALKLYKGNRRKAAEALGVSERTLYRKIDQYDLKEDE